MKRVLKQARWSNCTNTSWSLTADRTWCNFRFWHQVRYKTGCWTTGYVSKCISHPMSAAIYLTVFQRISKKFPSMSQCQGHHNKVVAHGRSWCEWLCCCLWIWWSHRTHFLCEIIIDPEPNASGEVVLQHRSPPCWALSLCSDPWSDIRPSGFGAFLSGGRDECSSGGDANPWVLY